MNERVDIGSAAPTSDYGGALDHGKVGQVLEISTNKKSVLIKATNQSSVLIVSTNQSKEFELLP